MVEGNVAALFHDLIDSASDGSDATTYTGYYVATVYAICQTKVGSSWYTRSGIDQLVWCFENRINSTLQSSEFPGRPAWIDYSESASEPGGWDADDIRATWLQNIGN
jgi:hypothetical protein